MLTIFLLAKYFTFSFVIFILQKRIRHPFPRPTCILHTEIHRNQWLLIHAIHQSSSLFKLIGNVLQQIHAAKLILSIPSVELDHVLDFVICSRVNLQRLGADVPINAFGARRSSQ